MRFDLATTTLVTHRTRVHQDMVLPLLAEAAGRRPLYGVIAARITAGDPPGPAGLASISAALRGFAGPAPAAVIRLADSPDVGEVTWCEVTVAGDDDPDPRPLITAATLAWLSGFELRASSDSVKRDLELTHDACGGYVCDAEPDDTMSSLVSMMLGHSCPPGQQP